MINSKNDLVKRLKKDINSVTFTTRQNHEKQGYQVGVNRKCCYMQSNAIRLQNPDGTKPWIYLDQINVKNNVLTYKHFNITIDLEVIK
ncbi:MAG TPA: hypothetical protein VFC60_00045 [Tissierellaceae bacterium]|nr:hypothetical protein [Tissierellaceae bacterium]